MFLNSFLIFCGLVLSATTASGRNALLLTGQSLNQLLGHSTTTTEETWTGKWFPFKPSERPKTSASDYLQHGGIPMGLTNRDCDDAKTNLTVDWDFSPLSYTCFYPTRPFIPSINVRPHLEVETVPKYYSAVHYCMNETISYEVALPTFGPHRPLWPRFGEYQFLPVQRWLHTLEHGGVVMLYHPCAHPLEVEHLRQIVRSCLFRHVITPSVQLSDDRPLALLTWGNRLTMSYVSKNIVRDFIQQHALRGPEKISRDGQYDEKLLKPANIVTDHDDSELCPPTSHSGTQRVRRFFDGI